MKRIYLTIILILAILIIPGVVIASDVTEAKYQGILRISNNSTLATSVSTNFSLNSASLITQGLASSGLTDIAITYGGADIPFMPGYGSNPWCVFVPSIGENTNLDYAFYTNNASGGNIKYFPGPSGMTINDDPSMELSDSYTLTVNDVYLTSSSDNIIAHKPGAASLIYSGGNVTYAVNGGATLTHAVDTGEHDIVVCFHNFVLFPNAAGVYSFCTPFGAANNYECVDESPHDNDTTYVYVASGTQHDLYNLPTPSYINAVPINQIDIHAVIKGNVAALYCYLYYQTHTDYRYYSDKKNLTTAYVDYNWTLSTNNYTGASWTWGEIEELQIGYALCPTGGNWERSTQSYVVVNCLASLFIDGVLVDTDITDATVPNTGDSWQVGSGATPYLREFIIEVGSIEKCSIDWEYGPTFTDDSGNGNDATPTFRTTSSDADVSASLISLSPVTEAELESWTFGNAGDMFVSDPTMPSQMYTFGDYQYIPGAEVFNALLDAGDFPRPLWWNIIIYIGIALTSLMLYGPARSVLIQVIYIECWLVVFGVIGAIPLAVAYLFPLPGVAIWLSQRHYGVG